MNAIKSISLSCLNINELSRTGTSLTTLTESLMTDVYIARQVSAITGSLSTVRKIKSTDLASGFTDGIQDADHDVDELLPMIETDLKSSVDKKRFFQAKGESAEALLKLFQLRDRKKLFFGGYTDQGEEIRTLFSDLFSSKYDVHRETSGAAPLFDTLKERFTTLSELLQARLDEESMPSTQREQKRILRYRLDKLIAYIDTNVVDEVEGFDAIHAPLNELITDVMGEYKARVSRKENQGN